MFIAEIGINHNGSIDLALELIRKAKEAGADVVKFQKRTPEICVPESQRDIIKDTVFGTMTYFEYKKKIEFEKEEYDKINSYCEEIGIQWTASVWDIPSLHFLLQYPVPFIKIPSALMTHRPLLKEVNKLCKDKLVIVSNGGLDEKTFDKNMKLLSKCNTIVLACNSSYPTDNCDLNLSYLPILKQKYKTIGYSGHEPDYMATLVAKSLGAEVIERHITLDKNMKGSDHKASLNIEELKELISKLEEVETILGEPQKVVSPQEAMVMTKLRYF